MTRKEEILNKAIEFVDKNYMDVGIKTTHEASVAACQEIAEWADKTMIEKACIGIDKLLSGYIIRNFHFGDSYDIDKLIEDFKNYMKKE